MATVGFCKVYRDRKGKAFCAMGVNGVEAAAFRQTGRQKQLQLLHTRERMRVQIEVRLDRLQELRQTSPSLASMTDTEFSLHRHENGTYSMSFFHVPLVKNGDMWQGKLEIHIGTVYVKVLPPVSRPQVKPEKNLPEVQHDDLLTEREQAAPKYEPSLYTLRQRKGIHFAWSVYKRCEKCLNLGEGHMCLVHKLAVEKNCVCPHFYPYTVHLGGGFSPR